MPRTFDLFALELALVERAAVVRAQIVDRVELTADVAHRDVVVADPVDRHLFRWNLVYGAHCLPRRHRREVSSVSAVHTRSSSAGSCSRDNVDWKKPSTMSCSAVERSNPRDCK